MKKILIIAMLLAATAARAFDFRVATAAGQYVYYSIIPGTTTVKAVNPNWSSHAEPMGFLALPATVEHNGVTYQLKAVDAEAFRGCSSLTGVSLPEGVTSLGRMAFAFCTSLDSIVLPSTLTVIGTQAFTGTAYFSNNAHFNADGLMIVGPFIIAARTNINGAITVPEGILGLGNMAFYNCRNIVRVILPETVRFIGQQAFNGCTSLDTLEMQGTVPPTLESNAFTDVEDFAVLVPCHSADTYRSTDNWSSLTIVEHCGHDGIADVEGQHFSVTAVDGGILINGMEQHFTISDIIGRRMAESKGGFVSLPSHGIYIVSTPGLKAVKVVY